MSGKTLLQTTAILLTSISIGICTFLYGQISGFYQGMMAAVPSVIDPAIKFGIHGPNFFDEVATKYSILALSFYICFIGRQIKTVEVSYCLCFLSLAVVLFVYWQLFRIKYGIDDSAALAYRDWLNTSIRLDWLSCGSAVILLVIQSFTVVLDREIKTQGK